jgi:hypothetical protein
MFWFPGRFVPTVRIISKSVPGSSGNLPFFWSAGARRQPRPRFGQAWDAGEDAAPKKSAVAAALCRRTPCNFWFSGRFCTSRTSAWTSSTRADASSAPADGASTGAGSVGRRAGSPSTCAFGVAARTFAPSPRAPGRGLRSKRPFYFGNGGD